MQLVEVPTHYVQFGEHFLHSPDKTYSLASLQPVFVSTQKPKFWRILVSTQVSHLLAYVHVKQLESHFSHIP